MNLLELTMAPHIAAAHNMGASWRPGLTPRFRAALLRSRHTYATDAYVMPALVISASKAAKRADDAFTAALEDVYGNDACNARYERERNGVTLELQRKRDAYHDASEHWHSLVVRERRDARGFDW